MKLTCDGARSAQHARFCAAPNVPPPTGALARTASPATGTPATGTISTRDFVDQVAIDGMFDVQLARMILNALAAPA